MVPFTMVVSQIFRESQSQISHSKRHQSFKALALDRKYKALGKSVEVRTVSGQPHCLDTSLVEDLSKCLRVQWIPVKQQIPFAKQKPVECIDEVACHLFHPRATRVHSYPEDLHLPARNI